MNIEEQSVEEQKSEKAELSHWLTYYQVLIDNIKFAKSQQWRLGYYVLLLFGTIVGLSKILGSKAEIVAILFIIALMLTFAGTHFLKRFQDNQIRYRRNIKKVRKKFPPDLREVARYEPAEEDREYYADFLTLLRGVIWISLFLVAWAIGFWQLLLTGLLNLVKNPGVTICHCKFFLF